ncbi:MAG: restriction endonuclease subunit S [Candidatus Thiodiazotropha sp. (ex Codakia orbicularis)]|nr:restriction endonuclease subunit S [Candidatus Thiodiazotropha sp. (ex Codakia orbicularis)]
MPEDFVKRDEQFIREYDILMSNANSYELVGKVSLVQGVPEKATLGAFITMLRARDDVDPRFFFYQLRSTRVVKEIRSRASTTTNISNVSTGKLKDIPLWVAPLDQQKRIVAKIEELFSHIDAGIDALKKAKQLLKQYRQSVLKAAVTGELTKEWREANKDKLEPASQLLERILKERRQKWEEQQLEQFKDKGKMPKDDKWKEKYKEPVFEGHADLEVCEDWTYVSLDMIADAIDPNPSHRMPKYVEIGVPFISTDNFEGQDEIDFSKGKKVAKETYEDLIKKYYIEEGDFAFSRIGTIGKTRLLPTDREYCLSHSLSIIKIKFSEVYPNYLRQVMSSKDVLKQALHGVQSVGVPDLGMAKIRNFEIPFPTLKEQELISEIIGDKTDSMTRLENEFEHQFIKAEKNKRAILASAFSGGLI